MPNSNNLDLSALEHIRKAIEGVRSERAQLSVVGRALTTEERQRLTILEESESQLEAIARRLEDSRRPIDTAPSPPTLSLPRDGRYELGRDRMALELRVDLAQMRVISGDLFAIAGEAREQVASFRSRPGVAVQRSDNPLALIAEDPEGQQSAGTLTVRNASEQNTAVDLRFDSALRGIGPMQTLSFTGRRTGDEMRRLGLEMEFEHGTERNPVWTLGSQQVTIPSSFAGAGFQVFDVGRRSEIPAPSAGFWEDGQLHALMSDLAQEPLGRQEWNLHVLMLSQHQEPRLLGVMFDSGGLDPNRTPREGVAVFQKPIRQRPDWQRKLIQTTVHELGHALNLAHRFERLLGRADSTSFMNYDWKYLGGENEALFWQRFAFTFDPDELEFLRHGPRHQIVPGSADFHTVPYWKNTRGGYVPYLPEVPGTEFRLKLLAPAAGELFQYGQPVTLGVELQNATTRAMDLPDFLLDPKAGFLEVIVERTTTNPTGDVAMRVFRPLFQRCYDLGAAGADLVQPGGIVSRNMNITYGAAGFTFIEPGNYRVTAVLGIPVGRPPQFERVFRSNTLTLRISYPKTPQDERDALEIFRHDIGYYLALGGSPVLAKAHDKLKEVCDRRQGEAKEVSDPLVASLVRSQAIHAGREYVRYRSGRFEVEKGDPAQSERLFASLRQVGRMVFDPATASQLARR